MNVSERVTTMEGAARGKLSPRRLVLLTTNTLDAYDTMHALWFP